LPAWGRILMHMDFDLKIKRKEAAWKNWAQIEG
jgi:hypothetical protein